MQRELTNEDINQAMSVHGAWSMKQLELIGVAWPPQKGWRREVVGSVMDCSAIDRFISLKNDHLPGHREKSKPKEPSGLIRSVRERAVRNVADFQGSKTTICPHRSGCQFPACMC